MPLRDRIWHFCYRHWYDNRQAGNRAREAVWGYINDLVVMTLWPKRKWIYRDERAVNRNGIEEPCPVCGKELKGEAHIHPRK